MLNADAMPKTQGQRLVAARILQQNRGNNGDLGGQLQEAKWLIKTSSSVSTRFARRAVYR